MAELEIPELPGRPLLEERVKNYPKVQWLLDKYADKAYPIVDKHDIEAVLTELLDDMDRWKGAYQTMKINFNNECDSHAADNERNESRIKELTNKVWHPYKDCGDAPKVAEYQKDVFLCKVQMYTSDNDEPVGTPVYNVLLCDDGGIFYGYRKNDGDCYNKVIAWTEIIG